MVQWLDAIVETLWQQGMLKLLLTSTGPLAIVGGSFFLAILWLYFGEIRRGFDPRIKVGNRRSIAKNLGSKTMADEMKTSSGGWGWNTVNSVLGVGALGSALGIGIPAITKAFSKDKCNGWNGGYGHGFGYGFGGCGCSENTVVNRFELGQSQRISELESARDTDAKILEAYKALAASDQRQDEKFAQLTKSLTDYVIANNREVDHRFAQLDKESALNTQEIRDNLRFLDYKIDNNQREMFAYVDCKTIPLQKKIGINSICPTPLAASTPLTANAQVLTTTPADTTGEVALNTVRVAK